MSAYILKYDFDGFQSFFNTNTNILQNRWEIRAGAKKNNAQQFNSSI